MHTSQIISQVLVSNPSVKANVASNEQKPSSTFNSVFKKEVSQQSMTNTARSNGAPRQDGVKTNQANQTNPPKVAESKDAPAEPATTVNPETRTDEVQTQESEEHIAAEDTQLATQNQTELLAFVQQFIQIDRSQNQLTPATSSDTNQEIETPLNLSNSTQALTSSNQLDADSLATKAQLSTDAGDATVPTSAMKVDTNTGREQTTLSLQDGAADIKKLLNKNDVSTDQTMRSADESLGDHRVEKIQAMPQTETKIVESTAASALTTEISNPHQAQLTEVRKPSTAVAPMVSPKATAESASTIDLPLNDSFSDNIQQAKALFGAETKIDKMAGRTQELAPAVNKQTEDQTIQELPLPPSTTEGAQQEMLANVNSQALRTNQESDSSVEEKDQGHKDIQVPRATKDKLAIQAEVSNATVQPTQKNLDTSNSRKEMSASGSQFTQALSVAERNNTAPAPTTVNVQTEQNKAVAVSEHISPRVGTKAWDQALSQKVVWMVAGGEQSAELSLNPPDLGPIQVVLSISDNQVDASFISSHLEVREAIESAAPKLKEMMDSAGISLSNFSVSSQASSNSQSFNNEQARNPVTSRSITGNVGGEPIATAAPIQKPRQQLGAVDTFA